MRNGLQLMGEEGAKLTITMSGRRPISIVRADWPKVASAAADKFGRAKQYLNVREHADGRVIVHGIEKPFGEARGAEAEKRAGLLLEPGEDVAAAIKWVADRLGFPDAMADECLAKLPPEDVV